MRKINDKIKTLSSNQVDLREQILRSMIASFKIEGINISEQHAKDIFEKVKLKLK